MRKRRETSPFDVLNWPLRLTWVGMWAEEIARAFWPLWTLLLLIFAAVWSGFLSNVDPTVSWLMALGALAFGGFGVWYAIRNFHIPKQINALDRLDRSLPGRPIQAATDAQAIGAGDHASEAVWRAHVSRMQERLKDAEPVPGDLRVSSRDPYGLRYIALLLFFITAGFGTRAGARVGRPGLRRHPTQESPACI